MQATFKKRSAEELAKQREKRVAKKKATGFRAELIKMMLEKIEVAPTGEIRKAVKVLRELKRSSLGEILGQPARSEVKAPRLPIAKPHKDASVEETLAAARARGAVLRQKMIKDAGGLLTTAEAAAVAGVTVQALHKRKQSGTALAVPVEGGDTGWPRFQFESPDMMEGVKRVLKKIGVDSPWMQINFFLAHLEELKDERPIDLIRAGKIEPVEIAASHFGEHGAA